MREAPKDDNPTHYLPITTLIHPESGSEKNVDDNEKNVKTELDHDLIRETLHGANPPQETDVGDALVQKYLKLGEKVAEPIVEPEPTASEPATGDKKEEAA